MKWPAYILSNNKQTREIIKNFICESELFEYIETLDIIQEISKADKSILIADISSDTEKVLTQIFDITKSNNNCKVLAIADTPSVDIIVKSMRAGAKEFLTMPLIKSEVFDVFNRLNESLQISPKKNTNCKIISVYSNKGGIGKTSIATNLALMLAKITKEKVALLDLNFQLGDVTTFVDIQPAFNVTYMLENLDKINEDFLLSTLEKYKDTSLYVLADPPNFKQSDEITPKQIAKLFKIIKETFSYIIIDMDSGLDAKNIATLTESDIIFLITTANLPAIRNTQRCLDLFDKLGFDQSKTKIILNRFMENDEVQEQDIKKVLDREIYWKIPNNYFTIMSAINKGIPVCEINPESNISISYRDLVFKLTDRIYKKEITNKYEKILGGKIGT